MIQSWPRLATTDTAPTTSLSPRRTGSEMHDQRLLERRSEKNGMADHGLALQGAQDALLQQLLAAPAPSSRCPARAPAPVGVHDADRVEAAAHLVLVAARARRCSRSASRARERPVGRLQLERARDGGHLAAQAAHVDRDLLGQAARLVELGRLLVELQDLAAARDELPGGADERARTPTPSSSSSSEKRMRPRRRGARSRAIGSGPAGRGAGRRHVARGRGAITS